MYARPVAPSWDGSTTRLDIQVWRPGVFVVAPAGQGVMPGHGTGRRHELAVGHERPGEHATAVGGAVERDVLTPVQLLDLGMIATGQPRFNRAVRRRRVGESRGEPAGVQ